MELNKKHIKKNTKNLCLSALGIALYVTTSMVLKIPIIGHASLDLGYIILAVYCFFYGSAAGMIVGSIGCLFVSLLTSGWFPPGWIIANLLIGFIVGKCSKLSTVKRIIVIFFAVFLGIFCIKTIIECFLYSIPLAVKIPKSLVVFIMDAIVMSFGTWLAPKLRLNIIKQKEENKIDSDISKE